MFIFLVQRALRYKDSLGDWDTICIANGGRNAESIKEIMEKIYPQWEYRIERIK